MPDGKITSFPMRSKARRMRQSSSPGSYGLHARVREEGMKKVIADPRVRPDANPMPFDGKRPIYGAFEMIVET